MEDEPQPQQHPMEVLGIGNPGVADGSEQDGVSGRELFPYVIRDGDAGADIRIRVDVELLELEVGARGAEHLDRLGDDLLPRSVAGQDRDVLSSHARGSLPSRATCSAGSFPSRSWAARSRTRSCAGTGSAAAETC